MNHQQKNAEIARLEKSLRDANYAIIDFRTHLNSEKFHIDTTIQVGDVHRRLDTIKSHLQ